MEQKWTTVILPKNRLFDLKLNELWKYRDLILMFVKRDFKTMYKQTILGPLWIVINPILTTLMQVIVFGNIANISTDGMPQFLFYMGGNTVWLYFSSCLTKTSGTFVNNSNVFGKVYFPRLVTPYYVANGVVHPNLTVLLLPVYILEIAVLGMGCGIIISALTTKYRDLAVLVTFGIQLWMYGSAVIYPVSSLPLQWQNLLMFNPVVPVIEAFRYSFTGRGTFSVLYLVLSTVISVIMLLGGMIIFNKVEKTFMDTV